MAVVSLQDFFGDVVVLDIPEPAVQLGHQDHINLVLLYILQEPQQPLPVFHGLSGRDPLIGVDAGYLIARPVGILQQGGLLGRKG